MENINKDTHIKPKEILELEEELGAAFEEVDSKDMLIHPTFNIGYSLNKKKEVIGLNISYHKIKKFKIS